VASIALDANARIDISKQRLRIFISTVVANIGDAGALVSSALADYRGQAASSYNSNAHTKARFAWMTNKILGLELYFTGKRSANCGAI
jgi:hypothetical protein